MSRKLDKAKDKLKYIWNVHLCPKIKPALRMFVIKKANKVADKHLND